MMIGGLALEGCRGQLHLAQRRGAQSRLDSTDLGLYESPAQGWDGGNHAESFGILPEWN